MSGTRSPHQETADIAVAASGAGEATVFKGSCS